MKSMTHGKNRGIAIVVVFIILLVVLNTLPICLVITKWALE